MASNLLNLTRKIIYMFNIINLISCGDQFNSSEPTNVAAKLGDQDAQATTSFSPQACTAESLRRNQQYGKSNFINPGKSRLEGRNITKDDCERQTGDPACVVPNCTQTVDSGDSDLNGPTICGWEGVISRTSGYTDGPTRFQARSNALADCLSGLGHVPGIECRVLTCFARNHKGK